MRITQNQFVKLAMSATQKHARTAFQAQEKIASGTKILRPSDDPTGTRRVLSLESQLDRVGEFSTNLDDARRFLDAGAEALNRVNNLITEVREAALAGANGTLTDEDRDTFAQQIDALREQIVGLANSRFQGQFLFGGTENTSPPFDLAGDAVTYRGNRDEIHAAVAPGLQTVLNVSGAEAFLSREPASVRFLGSTGVAAGATPSTLREEALLLLEHTATTLGDGALPGGGDSASGVAPGASSAAGDTVLGSLSITLTVLGDGSGGTVSLNGGTAVEFTTADTDLQVEGPGGEVVFLDLSGVTAGFDGDVSLDAQGTYSLDGGTTTTAIDFADGDQEIADPASGKTLQVDSRGVVRAGSVQVLFSGGLDLFETLGALRDDLRNDDGLESEALNERVRAHLEELDRHLETVLDKLADLGSRSSSLDTVRSFLDQQDFTLRDALSTLRDTNISETVIELVRAQGLLNAASAVSNQILQNSLVNGLQ